MSNTNLTTEIVEKRNKWDFTANAANLSFVSAALGLALCAVSFNSYQTYVSYYSLYGYSTPEAVGFRVIAGLAIASAALGILSGVYALVKKRFKVTLIGPILILVSGVATFAIETYYKLSYSDAITIPAAAMIVLSALALPLLLKSKMAFANYTIAPAGPEALELPPEPPAEPETTAPEQSAS